MAVTPRRSTRSKSKPSSIYKDALDQITQESKEEDSVSSNDNDDAKTANSDDTTTKGDNDDDVESNTNEDSMQVDSGNETNEPQEENDETGSEGATASEQEEEEEEEEEASSSSSSESESDDEEYQVTKKKPSTKSKSSATTKTKSKPFRTIQSLKASAATKTSTKSTQQKRSRLNTIMGKTKKTPIRSAKKSIISSLQTLSNKVLDQGETPDTSLVAALLKSIDPVTLSTFAATNSITGNMYNPSVLGEEESCSHTTTIYTPSLYTTAKNIVDIHVDNPNLAQIELLNLLFRSVGGTVDTNITSLKGLSYASYAKKMKASRMDNDDDEEENEDGEMVEPHSMEDEEAEEEVELLEDLDAEDWGQIVTAVVDEMRHTPPDCILLCADPDGAVHAETMHSLEAAAQKDAIAKGLLDEDEEEWDHVGPDATPTAGSTKKNLVSHYDVPVTSTSLGVREYRKIYEEFWYIFGTVALCEGGMSTIRSKVEDVDSSSEEEDEVLEKLNTTKKRQAAAAAAAAATTTRYDTEVVREVMNRLLELVSVGQPDVRSAATTSVLCLAQAVVDKTASLNEKLIKLSRQYAAATASSKKKGSNRNSGAKAESLGHQVDSIKRNKADLEEIVTNVVTSVFVHRYRDSNMFIRASCLNFLSLIVIRRPDVYLKDKYMKYFGWMMSDKSELVRIAAIEGLSLPYEVAKGSIGSTSSSSSNTAIVKVGGAKNRPKQDIDLTLMEHVCTKFLPRVIKCTRDIHVSVQESAMKLLLALLQNGNMDDIEDEQIWNNINLRALAPDTSPTVRRDALYFITEQLEVFDEEEDPRKKKSTKQMERWTVQRLDSIASWAAHSLTDGPIPMEKIRIQLVDYLVHSLRQMPEHKGLVTNWSAMLRAIMEDKAALTSQGKVAGTRSEVAKQRVLVQMLACAVKAEVGSLADAEFMQIGVDPDIIEAPKKQDRKKKMTEHEDLSVALITTLPGLLKKFSTENSILKSLTSLPRFLIDTVFSLAQRKSDFLSLSKNLLEIYLQTTDEEVLQNTACSMIYLCNGDHARASEARSMMQKCLGELQKRILNNLSEHIKVKNGTGEAASPKEEEGGEDDSILGDDGEEESNEVDRGHALYINMRRMRVLIKRLDIPLALDEDLEEGDASKTEKIFNSIADELAYILSSRKGGDSGMDDDVMGDKWTDSTWLKADEASVKVTSDIIHEGLQVLLSVVAWKLCGIQDEIAIDGDANTEASKQKDDVSEDTILDFRNRLISLVEMCFDQYLPDSEEKVYPSARMDWSENVQVSGALISSDLRTLFPKEWSHCVSSRLQAFALTNDKFMMGGFARFFRSKEKDLRQIYNVKSSAEDKSKAQALLLPLSRGLATNWKEGNRREAALVLSHITGSGEEASSLASALTRLLKKVDPVRLLESQMQSLRQSFEDWIDNDPGDDDDYYTNEDEMTQLEEAMKNHKEQFQTLVKQAHRFSLSQGIKKSDDKNISQAMNAFMLEGIKYSFSTSDDLMLGSRLPFLNVLSKYAHWIKKSEKLKGIFDAKMIEEETALKNHEEFDSVHEDDLEAISDFRAALNLGPSDVLTVGETTQFSMTQDSQDMMETQQSDEEDDVHTEMKTPQSRRSSIGSRHSTSSVARSMRSSHSVGSARSLMSNTKASLSPLLEEPRGDEEDSLEDSERLAKRKRSFDDDVSDLESPSSTRTPKRKKYGVKSNKYSFSK